MSANATAVNLPEPGTHLQDVNLTIVFKEGALKAIGLVPSTGGVVKSGNKILVYGGTIITNNHGVPSFLGPKGQIIAVGLNGIERIMDVDLLTVVYRSGD